MWRSTKLDSRFDLLHRSLLLLLLFVLPTVAAAKDYALVIGGSNSQDNAEKDFSESTQRFYKAFSKDWEVSSLYGNEKSKGQVAIKDNQALTAEKFITSLENYAPPSASSWNDFPVLAHYLGFPETGSKMLNDEFSQLFSDNHEAFKQELTRRRDANQKEFDPFLAHAKADRDLSVTLNSKETQEKARSFSSHLNVLRSAYYLLHEKSFDSPEINHCRDFILNPAK